jgi:hypothetical protein
VLPVKHPKFVQIAAAATSLPSEDEMYDGKMVFVVYGLTEDGEVWRRISSDEWELLE